ncbi:hypothetical protein M404DRAFT_55005, partial [Pisolithus tinctorius Marx 270]
NVLCIINIQHDCASSRCTGVQVVGERQENNETTRMKMIINHAPTNAFLLNTHALHNYRRITAVMP